MWGSRLHHHLDLCRSPDQPGSMGHGCSLLKDLARWDLWVLGWCRRHYQEMKEDLPSKEPKDEAA